MRATLGRPFLFAEGGSHKKAVPAIGDGTVPVTSLQFVADRIHSPPADLHVIANHKK